MFNKTLKGKGAWPVSIILITSTFCLVTYSRSQDQRAVDKTGSQKEAVDKERKSGQQSGKVDGAGKTDQGKKNAPKQANPAGAPAESADQAGNIENPDERRMKQAQSVIQDIYHLAGGIHNPVVRIKVRMLVADGYWNFQPDKAKVILSEDFSQIASISVPRNELEIGKIWSIKDLGKPPSYKGIELEMVKAQLRHEMLTIISSRDPAFARSLVASEKKEEKKEDHAGEERRLDEVLSTAGSLAESDPEAAARIIKESVKNGVSDQFPFLLTRLRENSPDEASAIFNQAFSAVRAKGDLWEFQKLIPYILPTEKDRLIGGKHYLTDSQRMKDTMMFMEYAIVLLARRIESEPPANMAPEFVRSEFYIWRNLLPVFKDLKPESVWLVNTRISQLSTILPQLAQGTDQGPWSDDRLQKLIAAAETSLGDKRDGYLESAAFNAWRFGGGDLNQAISLAEKIDNRERRDMATGNLYFQAGMKTLYDEGPDKALSLARKIKSPVMRSRLCAAIIGALRSVKITDQAEALHEELLIWLRSCESNTDTAAGVFEYLDRFTNDNPERSFAALDILVSVLNIASLDPPDKPLSRKNYWYPEFHDFRRSLASLAKADFERGLRAIQTLNNKEAAMLVQAAFCGEYLKMRSKNKKSPAKPRP